MVLKDLFLFDCHDEGKNNLMVNFVHSKDCIIIYLGHSLTLAILMVIVRWSPNPLTTHPTQIYHSHPTHNYTHIKRQTDQATCRLNWPKCWFSEIIFAYRLFWKLSKWNKKNCHRRNVNWDFALSTRMLVCRDLYVGTATISIFRTSSKYFDVYIIFLNKLNTFSYKTGNSIDHLAMFWRTECLNCQVQINNIISLIYMIIHRASH